MITAGGPADGDGSYRAALEIRTEEGWKTYWRYPGDSGIGTTADFSGSSNVASAMLAFPAPERHEDPYSTTIGYEGGAVLPITVKPGSPDAPAMLVADVSLGLCKDVCVPVTAHLEVPLGPDTARDATSGNAIAAARAKVPLPASAGDPLSVTDIAIEPGTKPVLRFTARLAKPDQPADLFVEGPDGSYLSVPERASQDGEKAVFTLSSDGLMHKGDTAELRLTLVNGGEAVDQRWTLDASTLD
ncbi:protein-disulfide reductase DsbD domain-containing protein [Breoghania corrubedonensis]|uniref:protein-disulfide reductase DsbD domain-containing protein n=1 Tax=Breoghania corrubedonensis TaxID=665038 RepID=UPI0014751B51|nr:protein-disulfide reductase DsbD domain-containing protein [Breoghania corrubedonensis]